MSGEKYSIKDNTQNLFVRMFSNAGSSYDMVPENRRTIFRNEADMLEVFDDISKGTADTISIITEYDPV